MANNVRTAEDLERKYNFSSLLGVTKNVKMVENSVTEVNNELNTFVNVTYKKQMENITGQIDGKTETWFQSGTPTLNNLPASDWTTDEEKEKHTGDLYYDKNTGYSYIFEYSVSSYVWTRVKDTDISIAMASANAAQDTADGKRQVYLSQPTTPYSSGDLWINNKEIYICQVSRAEGTYVSGDWINSLKYTDNTYATAIVSELGGETTEVLSGTVTQYSKSWVKFTDLATGGSTTINGANITTGTIDTDNVSIGNGNVTMDKDGIKLSNGAKVVGTNGLMNTYIFSSEGFKDCGYYIDTVITGESERRNVKIDVEIPTGLNITSAYVKIAHAPIKWGYQDSSYVDRTQWGYCRNLKLYKNSNLYSSIKYEEIGSEYWSEDTTTYEEITGAFGTNGWTATASSETTHNTEEYTSSDISSIFSSDTSLYELFIKPQQDIQSSWGTADGCARTGNVYAILVINGYMSY